MKSNKLVKNISGLLLLLLLSASAFWGWAKYKKGILESKPNVAPLAVEDEALIDTMKLERLKTAFDRLDVSKDEFLIDGYLSMVDGADSLANFNKVKYTFSRKGNLFYYQLDQMEMLNQKEMIIYIDATNKKILLSRTKEVIPPPIVPALGDLIARVKEEGYKLVDQMQGGRETIALRNPYHVSCKEFGLTFQSSTLKAERLYARLSNFEEPEDDKKDKIIDLYISRSSADSEIKKFLSKQVVVKDKGTWQLSPAYSDYQLINTLN